MLTKKQSSSIYKQICIKNYPEAQNMPGGAGLIPGQGTKIPHASWSKNQNVKQKQCCNKFNEDLKNGPYHKEP